MDVFKCTLHDIKRTGQGNGYLYCDECYKESTNSNLLAERAFTDVLRDKYLYLVLLPFSYSIVSIIVELIPIFDFWYIAIVKLFLAFVCSVAIKEVLTRRRARKIQVMIEPHPERII